MVQTNEDVLLSRAGMPDKIGSTAAMAVREREGRGATELSIPLGSAVKMGET